MRNMTRLTNPFALMTIGFIFLFGTGLVGWIIIPCFIHSKISEQIKLTRGSEVWEKWSNVPIPIYFKLYLFNVTNPEEVTKGEYPKLNEVGPFVYLEKREKTDIRETKNGTILYKEKITYYFQPEKSGGLSEEDVLTILNIPFVAMSLKISELPYPLSYLGSIYIAKFKEKPFIKKTVGEILFKGWHLPIVAEVEEYTGQQFLPNSTFGLFVGKNGTDDGDLEIDAGLTNTEDFGRVLSWRGKQKLEWWKEGSPCNEIKGTDGSIYPPFVSKSRVIRIFNAELCRSLFLTFEKEITFLGISSFRFTAPKEMLEDPRTSKDNRCFCSHDDVDQCLHNGAIDLSPCRDGAPVAMSTPHFLDAFQSYIDKSGLNPDKKKHETFIDIEPTSGLVLRASKRIQINVQMKPVSSLSSLSRLPEMLFPVIWADESAEIDDEIGEQLKSQLLKPLHFIDVSKWIAIGFSLIVISISFISFLFCSKPKSKETKHANNFSSILLLNNGLQKNPNGNREIEMTEKIKVPLILEN